MNLLNALILALIACLMALHSQAQFSTEQVVAVAQNTSSAPNPTGTFADVNDRTEYTRTIMKSLPVDSKDALAIENHFGDVLVSLWDRNEFRVQIVITSSSQNADRASKALNAVRIDERRNDNTYVFQTIIADEFNGSWKRGDRLNFLRIDYRVSMPKANTLTIKNSFGNTTIPDFWAPLSVESSFGNVYGAALNSLTNKIKASYGNVSIRDMQNGSIVMSFGDLVINSGNVLSVQQTYGKLNIGEANKVDARTSYTDALIGAVRQSGKFRMNYARQFRLERIGAAADQIDVEASYSTVALPVQSTPNCDFDVTVTHGGFTYPTLPNLQLQVQPTQPQVPVSAFIRPSAPTGEALRPNRPRQYVGRVGTGEGPRIRVVSTYGDVRFNK